MRMVWALLYALDRCAAWEHIVHAVGGDALTSVIGRPLEVQR
jgi:hypothetical protein